MGIEMVARISGEDAFRLTASNKASKWRGRGSSKIEDDIFLPSINPTFAFSKDSSVFTIGSCFARHIELALKQRGFHVPAFEQSFPREELWAGTAMPSGFLNKYTPHSMLNEVEFAFGTSTGEEFLVEVEGGYLDMQCHTNQPVSLDRAVERRVEIRHLYKDAILKSELVIITLGLIETWWDSENSVYLNETPSRDLLKRYPGRFEFEVMSATNTIDCVNKLITLMQEHGPSLQKMMISVSPVPLQRTFTDQDVVVANTYSKSILRVAAQEALTKFGNIDYYPSMESVLNSNKELSWEDDLVHPTQEIVGANVARMCSDYLLLNDDRN
jgi:hypothetical protein